MDVGQIRAKVCDPLSEMRLNENVRRKKSCKYGASGKPPLVQNRTGLLKSGGTEKRYAGHSDKD